ncbi:MAG: Cyclase [Acidimicrobiaceae bacterium]|nr:Cyclase [Acidimicrobiaceae bacterium]
MPSGSTAGDAESAMLEASPAALYTREQFDSLFESVKNWGTWGDDDVFGTLNYIGPDQIRRAAGLVRSGRSVSLSLPVNKVAGPDNPNPALHYMATGYDTDAGSSQVQFATDFIGMQFHGDCHSHIDALCHIAYRGQLYNGRPASAVTTSGASALDIANYANGIVGRGVLLDIPRLRGVPWLEPGTAVTRVELEAAEKEQRVRLEEGDLFIFRTGHHARRLALGPWDNGYEGEGKAGLHVDAIPLLHERRVAGFLPDGDGEAVPSSVEGVPYPIHPLQITAMGMMASDSLNLEDLAALCAEEQRWEVLVVAAPLRIPGATGSPFNPIAIL